jgi:UDP-N-acetylmuramyl pentapeptide phosphotransferase/UDP-N-acetylglucosamine-1-phosphate transferase
MPKALSKELNPPQKIPRSWILVIGLILLVLGLAHVRAPIQIDPLISFKTPEGILVHTQYNTVAAGPICTLTLKAAREAIQKACPECAITRVYCNPDQINPIEGRPSGLVYQFNGGQMLIQHEKPGLADQFCRALESAKIGLGRCLKTAAELAQPTKPAQPSLWSSSEIRRALLWSFLASLLTALLIVATRRWHLHWSGDLPSSGVQKIHADARPRIGGLAVFLGVVVGIGSLISTDSMLTPFATMSLLAGLPVFIFGLAEDVHKSISPSTRLWASVASALIAWWLTGIVLNRLDLPLVDHWLTWLPAAVLLTCFASAGLTNAVNIIDGQHGLAIGTVLLSLCGLSYLGIHQGDHQLSLAIIVVSASLMGLLLVNYPGGRLFLGDAGAYLIGFFLAWFAIALVVRNPNLSAWSVLVICGYPVIETVSSMVRRSRQGFKLDEPDREHLHSLIKRKVAVMDRRQQLDSDQQNALVAPLIGIGHATFIWLSIWIVDSSASGMVLFGLEFVVFLLLQRSLRQKPYLVP